jgi:hypothetical protein
VRRAPREPQRRRPGHGVVALDEGELA